jgi:hypothetical protein
LDPLPQTASCCRIFFLLIRDVATKVKIGSVTSESFLLPRVFPVATRRAVATTVIIGSVTSESFLLPRVSWWPRDAQWRQKSKQDPLPRKASCCPVCFLWPRGAQWQPRVQKSQQAGPTWFIH